MHGISLDSIGFVILFGMVGFLLTYRFTIWLEPISGRMPTLENLRAAVYAEISKHVTSYNSAGTTTVGFPQLRERLWQMIQYAVGRHDYYERVRRDFLTIGLGLIGAATALEAFLFRVQGDSVPPWFLVFGGAVVALTGLSLVFRYVYEFSPDYPYRNVADIRSWYHHYNLPRKESFKVRPSLHAIQMDQEAAREQLLKFAEGWLAWASPSAFDIRFVAEDLEQVFILYVLQQYKRVFARKLGTILLVGAVVFCICFLAHLISFPLPQAKLQLWAVCVGAAIGGVFGLVMQYP